MVQWLQFASHLCSSAWCTAEQAASIDANPGLLSRLHGRSQPRPFHPLPLVIAAADDGGCSCHIALLVCCAAGNVLLVKGAAECVLERCDRIMLPDGKVVTLTPAARTAVLETVNHMADNALRILAMARK
eukprot:GHRQ01021196.1.p2 GENE.GHRQ01021196.1~~GHRQ01021196.1.p2  ORF type:complete len:130 (-),score=33.92 GHRQ01021196.1:1264-1653(-)